jgi:hypothetical protein
MTSRGAVVCRINLMTSQGVSNADYVNDFTRSSLSQDYVNGVTKGCRKQDYVIDVTR